MKITIIISDQILRSIKNKVLCN